MGGLRKIRKLLISRTDGILAIDRHFKRDLAWAQAEEGKRSQASREAVWKRSFLLFV